ncbi:hypothetical protein [Evansella halocellulosilytica]|uniref:hypothetical protein n=1 Tax=Evansella halocellulosilytica TaxID=2011013 RepID=UPI000BB6F5AC|nr:hypothetical protein [Evansella halocellulosilytica]
MKSLLIGTMLLTTISFQGCNGNQTHPDISLTLKPSYVGETLYLTPVLTYDGEGEATVVFENDIAYINLVEIAGEEVYEHEVGDFEVDDQVLLEQGDEIAGRTVSFEAEPGEYEIYLIADFEMEHIGDNMQSFTHELTQTIDVRDKE